MHYAVAVALKFVAIRMGEFGISAAAGARDWKSEMRKRGRRRHLFGLKCYIAERRHSRPADRAALCPQWLQ
jgi:hypothetical protein